jgi:hypothetical protein
LINERGECNKEVSPSFSWNKYTHQIRGGFISSTFQYRAKAKLGKERTMGEVEFLSLSSQTRMGKR